jgi:hypothetical protein
MFYQVKVASVIAEAVVVTALRHDSQHSEVFNGEECGAVVRPSNILSCVVSQLQEQIQQDVLVRFHYVTPKREPPPVKKVAQKQTG